MGVLKINCYCTQVQMDRIVDCIVNHIDRMEIGQIADIDRTMNDIRICVDFGTQLGQLTLEAVEVLDSDWDVLPEDSAVLASLLKPIIEDYNHNQKHAMAQCCQIKKDQSLISQP